MLAIRLFFFFVIGDLDLVIWPCWGYVLPVWITSTKTKSYGSLPPPPTQTFSPELHHLLKVYQKVHVGSAKDVPICFVAKICNHFFRPWTDLAVDSPFVLPGKKDYLVQ